MKLEYGKRYVTRGGEVTGALVDSGSEDYPFYGIICNEGFSWKDTGDHFDGSVLNDRDLVSEYTEPATQEPQPGLTKREFMQQFVLKSLGATPDLPPDIHAKNAHWAWDCIEEKCK